MNNENNSILNKKNIPKHIVIIMDGNGRWAKQKNLDRLSGHKEGMKSASSVVKASKSLGIKYITLYAFSTQNWNRPKDEVTALMDLLKHFLIKEKDKLLSQDIKLNAIGRLNKLPQDVQKVLQDTINLTKKCRSMTLTLALNYGGREEIIDAVNNIIANKPVKEIDEKYFEKYLYTNKLPEPDLLIRTSGEIRLSNFLLWQLAYTEIYITKTLWPNFRKRHLTKAIKNFQNRERRYGLTGEQIQKREEN